MKKLTHIEPDAGPVMKDVSGKQSTKRRAVASGTVYMKSETLKRILSLSVEKGNVLEVARVAGIMGAKKVPDIIPLCHPILIDSVRVFIDPDRAGACLKIRAEAVAVGRTGVEMEALTAVAAAALTVYDMCKSLDREIRIADIILLEKSGGKSGRFVRRDGGVSQA